MCHLYWPCLVVAHSGHTQQGFLLQFNWYMYDEGVCYIFIISIIQWNIFTAQSGHGIFLRKFFCQADFWVLIFAPIRSSL